MCKKVLEYSLEGISLSMIYMKLGIADTTSYTWQKKYSIWDSTIKLAKRLRREVWIELARINLGNKDFNNVLWMMCMSNMFGWHSSKAQVDKDIRKTIKAEIKVPNYEEENNAKLAKVAAIFQSLETIRTSETKALPDPKIN